MQEMQETQFRSLGWENPMKMATNPSILAWKIPWIEEPGGVQSMGPQRVRHYLVTKEQQSQDGKQGFQMTKCTLGQSLTAHLGWSGNYVFPRPHAAWLFPRVPRAYFS